MPYKEHAQYPDLALVLQKWQLGFLLFLYFVVHNLFPLHMHTVIFSLSQFLCIFVAGRDIYPGASTEAKDPGPRSQVQPDSKTLCGLHTHILSIHAFSSVPTYPLKW